MALLKEFLHSLPISNEATNDLINAWTIKRSLKKGDFLITEGQIERHLFFITKGCLSIYYEQDGLQQVVGFGYSETLICSFPSFIKNLPSDYYIKTLSNTELIGIDRVTFYQLLDQYISLEKAWRTMLEEALLGRIEREIDILTVSPKVRLQRLLNRSPHLFQIVPLKYIASYLSMAPETLSRNMKS